jgi:hypothetical protein
MITEDTRYKLYRWGAHLAWWGALGWAIALTWVNLQRGAALPGAFQRISGIAIILLVGVAIALGSALSRMRLARTIGNVFEAGMRIASNKHLEERTEDRVRGDAAEVRRLVERAEDIDREKEQHGRNHPTA